MTWIRILAPFLILYVGISGCTGKCDDAPMPIIKYTLVPSADTVNLGDTIGYRDQSFCNKLSVQCYRVDSTQYMIFSTDSLGSFGPAQGSYSVERIYSDSLRTRFNYDTTNHLELRLIMNGGRGRYVVEIEGENTHTACVNGVPMTENAPLQSIVRDTIYVK